MTANNLRFLLLGPLVIRDDLGNDVPLPSARERKILAVLLLAPNRPATVQRLVDTVWPDNPPATAREQIQNCAGMLRKRLRASLTGVDLTNSPAGYQLRLPKGSVDVQLFSDFCGSAHVADKSTDPGQEAGRLGAVLRLWRGRAAEDVDAAELEPARVHLEELRINALIRYSELLADGQPEAAALAELCGWADASGNEAVCMALARLLWRAGRPVDALAHLQRLRDRLATEFGLDLPPAAQALRLQILHSSSTRRTTPAAASADLLQTLARHLSIANELLVQMVAAAAP